MTEADRAVTIDVMVEFYLKGRIDSVHIMAAVPLDLSIFEDCTDLVEMFQAAVSASFLAVFDTKGEQRYVMRDTRHSIFIIKVDEVQAMYILAPDVETLQKLLAMAE